jgi:creatinine deaminase
MGEAEPGAAGQPERAAGPERAEQERFMAAAIAEARLGLAEGGIPIGSVLVRGGQIVGRGHNRRVQRGDPMAHAEIDCLRQAGRQRSYRDTVLYSTLAPCYLCSGAVVQFGIPEVVIGEARTFPGAPDLLDRHGVRVVDLDLPECRALMTDFIAAHPELWGEDIGDDSPE